MIMLPNEAIQEFKELYRKDYGTVLSDEDATDKATHLFAVLETVYKPNLTSFSKEAHNEITRL